MPPSALSPASNGQRCCVGRVEQSVLGTYQFAFRLTDAGVVLFDAAADGEAFTSNTTPRFCGPGASISAPARIPTLDESTTEPGETRAHEFETK